MPRRLPWKEYPDDSERQSDPVRDPITRASHGSQRQREQQDRDSAAPEARTKKPNPTEDWLWRMTESEFVATAQLYTADMHEQAYRKLLDKQARDAERLTTIDELLDQPLVQQALPTLPPKPKLAPKFSRGTSVKAESVLTKRTTRPEIEEEPKAKNAVSANRPATAIASSCEKTKPDALPEPQSLTEKDFWDATPTTAPTAAALARKRRRLQAKQADDDFVPLL